MRRTTLSTFAALAVAGQAAFLPAPVSHDFASRATASIASSSSADLSFNLTSGQNVNYVFRNNVTAAQVLLTAPNASLGLSRFVVALPAGNSGSLVYFIPKNDSSGSDNSTSTKALQVTLDGGLKATKGSHNATGVKGKLSFNKNATVGVTIIGAVRAMRDYTEGSGLMHEEFNYTVSTANSSLIHLHRKNINGTKTYDLYLSAVSNLHFNVTPSNNGTYTPPTIDILLNSSSSSNSRGTLAFRSLTNETSLEGLGPSRLFLPASNSSGQSNAAQRNALKGLADGTDENGSTMSFLTYADKFTAGGWRFLTYFGRDSLLTLRFLMPIMTSEAIEAALAAVLERTNSTGALCHEETIGDYASYVNMQNNRSDLGDTPYYDYKMVDTDLLLLPAMSHYFLELPQGQGRAKTFLAKKATLQNGTYAQLLDKNIRYNVERAQPFAQNATYSNLIGLREGQPVGNWRDSNEGLGYGQYPFDVNAALVPAALRSISSLASAGIISSAYRNTTSTAQTWEQKAPGLFDVSVNSSTAQSRLQNFVQQANLSTALLQKSGNTTNATEDFYALSLNKDGSPVEVLNSDLGFALLYATNVSSTLLTRVVSALRPYPRGLLTNVGMLVANPAYDSNTTNIEVLNRAAYHGTVSWSWQNALMAAGLARQLSFCDNSTLSVDYIAQPATRPSWCRNSGLVRGLKQAQTNLWNSINGAKSEKFSEVWSNTFNNATSTFTVADLGSLSPTGTESDAIQLWSFAFLALVDPTASSSGQSSSSRKVRR